MDSGRKEEKAKVIASLCCHASELGLKRHHLPSHFTYSHLGRFSQEYID